MLREQYVGRPRIRLSSTLREENDFIVRANPYLLGIALQNVVDNACKYSDKDVEISLFEKEGRRVVEIRDQGIGIPQEEVELIFQSFYRASNTRFLQGARHRAKPFFENYIYLRRPNGNPFGRGTFYHRKYNFSSVPSRRINNR